MITAPAPRSAYIHIPFCHRRCFYCDFAVVPLGDQADASGGPGSRSIALYLEQLLEEISSSPAGPPLATVYIGGVLPLTPAQVGQVLKALRRRFGLQSGAEISLEMDPASFGRLDLEALTQQGVNRVSLGGQSFDDEVLASLGRRHRRADLLEACAWLQAAVVQGRLASWSLDLIRNLPDQTDAAWADQLEQALASCPISPFTTWSPARCFLAWNSAVICRCPMRMVRRIASLPPASGCHGLATAATKPTHFALPGHASRHNRVYWSGAGWWAFGLGATSAPWGERLARPRTREAYAGWLQEQRLQGPDRSLVQATASPLSLEDRLLVGLRRHEGVDLIRQAGCCGWSAADCRRWLPLLEQRWEPFRQTGLMQCHGSRWRLSDPLGMAVSNAVLVELVAWWEEVSVDAVPSASSSGL